MHYTAACMHACERVSFIWRQETSGRALTLFLSLPLYLFLSFFHTHVHTHTHGHVTVI